MTKKITYSPFDFYKSSKIFFCQNSFLVYSIRSQTIFFRIFPQRIRNFSISCNDKILESQKTPNFTKQKAGVRQT